MARIIGSDVKRLVSYKKKRANDFQRQKDYMDILDMAYGDYRDYNQIETFDINYDLFNGRLDVELYEDPICLNIEEEKINFDFTSITHYPLISQVANAMHGEMISRPFNPIAKDIGSFAQTLRNKKYNELLRQLMDERIIAPIRNEVTQAYFRENGITDPFSLSPDQMQQAQSDIQNRSVAKTPEDVLNFMMNDFQTPTQRQAQQLLDYFIEYQDIKYKQQEGFKHAIITAREVYYVGDRHNEPVMELCNPKYITWGGSRDSEWVQDASWCKYEHWLTIEDALQKYAEKLSRKDYNELLGYAEPIGGIRSVGDPEKDSVQNRTMYELSVEDSWISKKYSDLNYKTKEGQRRYIDLYNDIIEKYGAEYGRGFANYGIREAHICWRDKRKLKRITRIIDGKFHKFWQDEHYEPQPEDVKVMEVWVDEIWEGKKIGAHGSDWLYVDVRPVPGQYKSVFDPYGVKLPYWGKDYNSHMNNAKNVSIIDLGKAWQKEFDITMTLIKHDMATDIGKVFLMGLDLKPENWKWQDWFNTMRNAKVLMTNMRKHGYGAIDPSVVRSIDLSKASDIASKVDYLNIVRENLILSMNFNSTRIGTIGQYSTNENIVSSQSASYNQTEGYFETHRMIVEKALNAFMNTARLLYKENRKRHFILDDVTRTELEVSPDFWYEEWAIEVSTSTEDIRRLEELRNNMLTFLQNGMGHEAVIEFMMAKNPADVMAAVKKESKRQEKLMQQQQEMELQQRREELQIDLMKEKQKQEFELMKQERQLQSQELRVMLDREKFQMQADADDDGRADVIEKAEIETESREKIEMAKLEAKKEIEREKNKIKEKEIQVKKKEAKSKPKK